MHVHVHRNVEFIAVHRDLPERRVGDRVRCVRRERALDQRQLANFVVHGERLVQVFVGVLRPGRRKVEHDQADDAAHADGLQRAGDLVREVEHVAQAGRAAANHLGRGEAHAVGGKLGIDPARLGRPDVLGQPFHQRQVVGEPAEQAHRRVGMGVDQAR